MMDIDVVLLGMRRTYRALIALHLVVLISNALVLVCATANTTSGTARWGHMTLVCWKERGHAPRCVLTERF